MTWLTRDDVEAIVTSALKEVADFNGDVENYTFDHFDKALMRTFIDAVDDGMREKGYTVVLSVSLIENYVELGKTVGEFIDYVNDSQEHAD